MKFLITTDAAIYSELKLCITPQDLSKNERGRGGLFLTNSFLERLDFKSTA